MKFLFLFLAGLLVFGITLYSIFQYNKIDLLKNTKDLFFKPVKIVMPSVMYENPIGPIQKAPFQLNSSLLQRFR